MAYLIITNGLDQGQLFELPEGKHILGRDEKAEIHIDLSAVSRKHASFEVSATRTIIRDLASSNGTLVNDSPVSDSIELIDGDTIQIADLVLQFFASAEPKAAKAQTQNFSQIYALHVGVAVDAGARQRSRCETAPTIASCGEVLSLDTMAP